MKSKIFPLSLLKFIKQKKLVLVFVLLIFIPSLFTYFSGDDWSHLRLAQIDSFSSFVNFFSFKTNPQTAAFYRPLSTQVFFFIFQSIFGLKSFFYHLFVLTAFIYSLYLLYSLCLVLFKNNKFIANVSLLIYAFSATNFTRLYFLSAFQEVAMIIFVLLSFIYFLKNKKTSVLSLLFFVLALMSKETAVVLPAIVLTYSLVFTKKNSLKEVLKKHLPFWLISITYLLLRFFVFKLPVGDSYIFSFLPSKILNTLLWYVLWSFGTPELLVDYVSSGLRPLPRLFTDYPIWSYIMILGTLISVSVSGYVFFKNLRKFTKEHFFSLFIFLVSISPLLVLPFHKFTLELGLPLVGFSIFIALLLKNHPKVSKIFLFTFILFNLSTNYLTYTRHYSVQRSKTAKKIHQYFQSEYPKYPKDSYLEFINDTADYGALWGSSKQIAHTTSHSDMFKVIYNDHSIKVFFEDIKEDRPLGKQPIKISTKKFFK
jgi:hypothetical protein